MASEKEPLNSPVIQDSDSDSDDEDKRTIYCCNLSDRVTEDILYELFLQSGPIETVRIPKDKDGKTRSFGFVTFIYACSVPYSLQLLRGIKLYNRELITRCQYRPTNNDVNNSPQRAVQSPRSDNVLAQSPQNFNGTLDFMQPSHYNKLSDNRRINPFAVPSLLGLPKNAETKQRNKKNGNDLKMTSKSERSRRSPSPPYKRPDRNKSHRSNRRHWI